MKLVEYTPVEEYRDAQYGIPYFVKREDLCVPEGGPPFSKMRGLVAHLERLAQAGKTIIGYTESSVSMAGWGVAWACRQMGLKCVIFDPQYKEGNTPRLLEYHREKWIEYGAELIPQDAGMVKVNYAIARQILRDKYGPESVMLDLGLPLKETVDATCAQAEETLDRAIVRTVIVNVGSGTIAAGIGRALQDAGGTCLYAIMGRTGDVKRKKDTIREKGRFTTLERGGMFGMRLKVIDPGWNYTEYSRASAPFPCHPYYDLKAFEWMSNSIRHLEKPILFWNIGHMPEGWYI